MGLWFGSHATYDHIIDEPIEIPALTNSTPIDARSFIEVSQVGSRKDEHNSSDIEGGLVPHHDVAAKLIQDFYRALDQDDIDLILLIGPNHQGKGSRYQVVGSTYETYNGLVEPTNYVDQVLKLHGVDLADPEMLSVEHSVGLHMNYIKAYFPDIPALTLLVHEFGGSKGVMDQVENLYQLLKDKKVLVIGSVDFSHYLPVDKADVMDKQTLKIFKENRFELLWTLTNESMDSPTTAFMTTQLLNKMGANDFTVLGHDNSARILQQATMNQTTSYFLMGYR